MSHLYRITTRVADRELLVSALDQLGDEVREGPATIRSMLGERREAELYVCAGSGPRAFDVGFAHSDGVSEIVADRYGKKGATGAGLRVWPVPPASSCR